MENEKRELKKKSHRYILHFIYFFIGVLTGDGHSETYNNKEYKLTEHKSKKCHQKRKIKYENSKMH